MKKFDTRETVSSDLIGWSGSGTKPKAGGDRFSETGSQYGGSQASSNA